MERAVYPATYDNYYAHWKEGWGIRWNGRRWVKARRKK